VATASTAYGAVQTLVSTGLTTLASDTNLLAGWASAVVDNTAALGAAGSNFAIDVLVGLTFTVGTTTPVANRQLELWAYGTWDNATYTAGITGTVGTVTLTAAEKSNLRLLQIFATDATASHAYEAGPCSLAAAFGGVVPQKWGLFIVQNSGAALSAAAPKFTTVNFTSA
jgi:hypothetical protein